MADLPLLFDLSSFAKGRMPFVRAMSMEQRWQDLANLLSLPGPVDAAAAANMTHPFAHHHHHHHYHGVAYPPDNSRSVLLHNATLAPPVGDLNTTSPYSSGSMIGVSNLGSAVATSMNLTNSSEPMGDTSSTAFKTDTNHDMMYYQCCCTRTDNIGVGAGADIGGSEIPCNLMALLHTTPTRQHYRDDYQPAGAMSAAPFTNTPISVRRAGSHVVCSPPSIKLPMPLKHRQQYCRCVCNNPRSLTSCPPALVDLTWWCRTAVAPVCNTIMLPSGVNLTVYALGLHVHFTDPKAKKCSLRVL
uniref:Uncharacterized protein n=1 Tax=Timema poppense TaxID=170557 RepID=A0A7R9CR42_TIMPO|nr:unnamed protein product [Timema poppensis]